MDSKIIEALKKNEKPFTLMTREMQDAAGSLGKNGYFSCFDERGWTEIDDDTHTCEFNKLIVYKLRPDYLEQPAIIECEVKEYKGTLRWHHADGTQIACITHATEYPDFIGFKYEDGSVASYARRYQSGAMTTMTICTVADDCVGNYEVLTPTHVLFSK